MSAFDPKLWRKRAWDRLRRAVLRGGDKGVVETTYAADMYAISDLEALIAWCDGRKITVDFVKKASATFIPSSLTIKMSSRMSPRRQVVLLLHECGHHLIGMHDHHERFGAGYPRGGEEEWSRTFHHRVACLDEEMEAWHRGWKLVKRLGLSVDRGFYDEVRLECIRSYIQWTLRPGQWKREEEE